MKPVLTGISCMALVAVLATWSLGEGNEGPETESTIEVVVETDSQDVATVVGESADLVLENVAAFDVGTDEERIGLATAVAEGSGDAANVEIQVEAVEGGKPQVLRWKALKGAPPGAAHATSVTRTISVVGGAASDEVKKSLEKLADELTEQAAALEREGKAEEAQTRKKTAASIRELAQGPRTGTFIATGAGPQVITARISEPGAPEMRHRVQTKIIGKGPEFAEVRELTEKLEALRAEAKQTAGDPQSEASKELSARVKQLEKQLAASREKLKVFAFAPTVVPLPPGAPVLAGTHHEVFDLAIHGDGHPGTQALRSQADALLKASRALKEAGKHAEAKRLMAESEELKAKSEQATQRVLNHAAPNPHRDVLILHGSPAAPGVELHSAVKELQEQVQLLRKEVAELKELLKK